MSPFDPERFRKEWEGLDEAEGWPDGFKPAPVRMEHLEENDNLQEWTGLDVEVQIGAPDEDGIEEMPEYILGAQYKRKGLARHLCPYKSNTPPAILFYAGYDAT